MDFVPDKEFHRVFIRINHEIPLKGAFTPEEANARIIDRAKAWKYLAKSGYVNARAAYRHADNLEKLVYTQGTDFGTRAISTARRHPYGVENLTLNYGYTKAVDILLERNIKLRRMTRMEHTLRRMKHTPRRMYHPPRRMRRTTRRMRRTPRRMRR